MKRFVIVLAALLMQTLAQQIQFTNTTFDEPIAVGQLWSISWTTGNGLPVSLSIGNATWNFPIFTERAILPNTFTWTVANPAEFVTGDYQLSITQLGTTGTTFSPVFHVDVPVGSPNLFTTATGTIPPAENTGVVALAPQGTGGPVATVTLTYVYLDHECGCTRTKTTASPLNTGMALTTYFWYNEDCSCTKSAVVPMSTLAGGSTNYTAPMSPPVPAASTTQSSSPATTTTAKVGSGYSGNAARLTSSGLGLVVLMAAAIIA